MDKYWILCPKCGGKTRIMVTMDTEIKQLPLFCPKCKQETMIDVAKTDVKQIK